MKTAALYVRVSTRHQNTDTQLVALRDYARRRGFESTLEYIDEVSSAKVRPQFNGLREDARVRRFDAVIVARFDRFARSVTELVNALEEFQALGIDFISLGESIDTSTPIGKMVFSFIAAVAEFERSIIRERVHLGLERARREGKKLGRPKRIVDSEKVDRLFTEGNNQTAIAQKCRISRRTVKRLLIKAGKNPATLFAREGPYDSTSEFVAAGGKTN